MDTEVTNVTRPGLSFSRLLGAWYSVFPFKLSELTLGFPITYKMTERDKKITLSSHSGLRPELKPAQRKDLMHHFDEDEALENYKQEAKEVSKGLSFISSSGSKNIGGICSNDTSFRSTLCRYFRESLADDIENLERASGMGMYGSTNFTFGVSPAGRAMGIHSTHRTLLGCQNPNETVELADTFGVRSYLAPKELWLLHCYMKDEMGERKHNAKSINGLLTHFENLHHEPVEHIDGLKVELFDFQREAVGWAIERERAPGGVQSFLWTKVPNGTNEYISARKVTPVDLYYSPILDTFTKEKPSDVRGGIIAEQMGLGKTVISLAIILKNPAPLNPASGKLVSKKSPILKKPSLNDNIIAWPEPKTLFGDPKNRAKYYCRGTLVICNVSLVGQWIDEAKSKLRDPGLVYSYHGSKRLRLPEVLAKNAIVVTTYATLAADDGLHRKKSKDRNYCGKIVFVLNVIR